ncbi:hypothetical protein [Verrucomicrobium spinosum]|uniref:hypothetical protein n=1 Tax=Verrucomicrobium spinosum TaxID=2736 RepID=UPI0001745C08|nr:hypothetical protein [Verrucomicrobium spinosum]
MTSKEASLGAIRIMIEQMPKAQQKRIQKAAEDIKATLKKHGPDGLRALALVGAELTELEIPG